MLADRAKLLQGEFQRAKQNVLSLNEQLEQAKIHLNTVFGHLNEVAYLMGEEQKSNPQPTDLLPKEHMAAMDSKTEDSKEMEDGEVDSENQEQTS